MFLFFDIESSGLPKNYQAPMSDVDNWPRIAQLAWQLYDKDHLLIMEQCEMIYPEGWEIPKEKFFIDNGMSTERCIADGLPIRKVIERLILDLNMSEYIIAHNLAFDKPILGAEMIRLGLSAKKPLKGVCTMNLTTEFCKLPGKFSGKYKWPRLEELYKILFGYEMEGAHDALSDVSATAKVFFECLNRGIIKI